MLRLVVDNTQEFKEDLFNQLMEYGYTAQESERFVNKKIDNINEINKVRNRAYILKITPIRYLNIPRDKISAEKYLTTLGYDVKRSGWAIDVCCYTWAGKLECGEVVVGSERTDKEWTNLRVDGKRMCSDEALFNNSGIDLRGMGYLKG